MIDGKAKHSPTNDWDTNAVWVDARRAMTVTQERHTEPQDKTLVRREAAEEKKNSELPRTTLGTGLARTGTHTGTPLEPPQEKQVGR